MDQAPQIQLYLQQTYLFQHPSQILSLQETVLEEAKTLVQKRLIRILLKENIFHPQGGGQPNDEGTLKLADIVVPVVNVLNKRDEQRVYLEIENDEERLKALQEIEKTGGMVEQRVDGEKRRLFAQLHSGGHLLDMAVKRVGLKWIPGKGFHFPEGAYVEYIGSMDGVNAEEVRKQLEEICGQIQKDTVEEDGRKLSELNEEQLKQKMGELPEYLKGLGSVRYVELSKEDSGCPCGGTHVEHLREIGQFVVSKIQKKGKNIRVSYAIKK